MSKKFVLGKGLGALIPDELEPKEKKNNSEMFISINLIKSNENQPRKAFDDEKIAELAESIKHHGIVQPIILRKDKE